jgi:DNA-binding transcriptional regulator YiaG
MASTLELLKKSVAKKLAVNVAAQAEKIINQFDEKTLVEAMAAFIMQQTGGKSEKIAKVMKAEQPEKDTGDSWTYRDVERLRAKTGLNKHKFAKALGVSFICTYFWSKKRGVLRLFDSSAASLAAVAREHNFRK